MLYIHHTLTNCFYNRFSFIVREISAFIAVTDHYLRAPLFCIHSDSGCFEGADCGPTGTKTQTKGSKTLPHGIFTLGSLFLTSYINFLV